MGIFWGCLSVPVLEWHGSGGHLYFLMLVCASPINTSEIKWNKNNRMQKVKVKWGISPSLQMLFVNYWTKESQRDNSANVNHISYQLIKFIFCFTTICCWHYITSIMSLPILALLSCGQFWILALHALQFGKYLMIKRSPAILIHNSMHIHSSKYPHFQLLIFVIPSTATAGEDVDNEKLNIAPRSSS